MNRRSPIDAARRAVCALFTMPAPLARRLAGPPMRSDRGEVLDPQLQLLLRMHKLLPRIDGPVATKRREMRLSAQLVAAPWPLGVRTSPTTLAGLPARRYDPAIRASAAVPALLYFHGGGFVAGDLESHDAICATLSAHAKCVVISVDYRLAPEHPFPAPVEDAVSAWQALVREAPALGLDADRLVVGGDSAGGNLATVACRLVRDSGARLPRGQLLIYPATDMTRACESHRTLARGYYLEDTTIQWFLDNYLTRHEDALDPRASPMFSGRLDGLPRAHVVTAGFDPLRDEGEQYADLLERSGVRVTKQPEPSQIHGFANMAGASAGSLAALRRVGDGLAALLA